MKWSYTGGTVNVAGRASLRIILNNWFLSQTRYRPVIDFSASKIWKTPGEIERLKVWVIEVCSFSVPEKNLVYSVCIRVAILLGVLFGVNLDFIDHPIAWTRYKPQPLQLPSTFHPVNIGMVDVVLITTEMWTKCPCKMKDAHFTQPLRVQCYVRGLDRTIYFHYIGKRTWQARRY